MEFFLNFNSLCVAEFVVEVAALEGVGVISVITDGGGKAPTALAGPNFDGFLTFGESLKKKILIIICSLIFTGII